MYRLWLYCEYAKEDEETEPFLDVYPTIDLLEMGRVASFVQEVARWTRVMQAPTFVDDFCKLLASATGPS
jgi:hypothetical protein